MPFPVKTFVGHDVWCDYDRGINFSYVPPFFGKIPLSKRA